MKTMQTLFILGATFIVAGGLFLALSVNESAKDRLRKDAEHVLFLKQQTEGIKNGSTIYIPNGTWVGIKDLRCTHCKHSIHISEPINAHELEPSTHIYLMPDFKGTYAIRVSDEADSNMKDVHLDMLFLTNPVDMIGIDLPTDNKISSN